MQIRCLNQKTMKKELDIYEPYVKGLWDFYNDKTK